MVNLKEKLPMVIAVIVAIAVCVAALYFFENYICRKRSKK